MTVMAGNGFIFILMFIPSVKINDINLDSTVTDLSVDGANKGIAS